MLELKRVWRKDALDAFGCFDYGVDRGSVGVFGFGGFDLFVGFGVFGGFVTLRGAAGGED